MDSESIESIENFKEFKPILQQQILDKELKFMEEVRQNHEAFKDLDSNLSFLIECVDSLKKRVVELSNELNQTFTGFQNLHGEAKKINQLVEQDKHAHMLICSLLTKCIPPPELIQRLLTTPVDEKYGRDLTLYHQILVSFEDMKELYKESPIIKLCKEYHKHTTQIICQRIYEVISDKLNKLSQSNPIILQHLLANNYSIHFRFLMYYSEENCVLLRNNHMETMKILLLQYFQCYTEELLKLKSNKPISKTFELIEYLPKEKKFNPCTEKEKDVIGALNKIKTRIDIQRNISNLDDQIIIPAIQNDTKDNKFELETIIDSLYRVLFDTIASHVDCYCRLYRKLNIDNSQMINEVNDMVKIVFEPIFQYLMQTIIERLIIYQNLDSFSYFIYLREFVNCQNFIDKNYNILNGVIPLREHLNTVTQLVITKVNFLLNNTIIFVQNASNQPKKEKSPIHLLTRKYAQYNALLHYAHVIHYYQDLEELQWKFRTSIESYIVKTSAFENNNAEINTVFNEFLNIVYITCFLKEQDEQFMKSQKDIHDLSIKEKQTMNVDIFNFQHNLEMKRETLGNLLVEKFFFFLLETINRVKSFEYKKDQHGVNETELTQFIDHLRGFVPTFKQKWIIKLKEMMLFTVEISEIKDKTIEYWNDVEKEIHTELQRYVLKYFLTLCEDFDKKLKGDLIPSENRLELVRGFTTFAAIYAEVTKYMEAIQKGISFSSIK
ncbi:Vps52 / Sac2 family protein [Entamoeba histolytica HM-1:IMSS-B]|uniref:Uncharacterized protein n=5 Tax=Entamoeba histolytica TaxID=5759 RepID=C4M5S1_ENTH1|nr:hypothetical protein EHI_070700 [Entamoeba histolytica HM-1:IMSS]EMH77525.1 Vps52 / Sac2 family protein [Entamoeba histolytica HM-1:IMSS-B]EMS14730.1 Vps52 / Sac2 family protein [Entamoeba histolytica HM-3:IMSS]ENY65346.1 Vps52 / Sac2 family protein, putative [Entamoeba histolytica HM-1:IMSS-A]GAT96790.1 hypothetical protein CL6EHI_070700 [Entamoeba histolytica]EAL48922.1 hypothetical protein EHI_070700 [Entamoeba histolytica HM-1:IMSS]|eukprot:XP_654308.1 hypothetical protein EHI_070700 [Entamoeba histolytica HM-1:IMSS]